jgi:hypothetical protein
LIKGTIYQEEKTNVNIYALNVRTPNFIKQAQLDIKSQIDFRIIIVDDFSTRLSKTDRSSRPKPKKKKKKKKRKSPE